MKRLTKENFIERAKNVHGDKYDYSKVEYKNARTKVCIICPIHGEFWQVPSSHLKGIGCPRCGFETSLEKRTKSTEDFINEARKIHGDKYNYSKVKYVNMKTKVCIICPIHGEFWQTPLNHLNSNGCYSCGRDDYAKTHNKSIFQFINEAKNVHGDKYDYSKVEYKNAYTSVCIICPIHGEFWQRPLEHLHGCGCPRCNESHLERDIRHLLEDKKVNYIYQCRRKNLNWIGRQSLDFYLPDYNVAIECQGIQHFYEQTNDLFNHKKIIDRDIKKYIKCISNGVRLFYYSDTEPNNKLLIYNKDNTFTNKEELMKKIML